MLEMSLSLSDTTCLIQDVVSTPCGDTRMARRCMQVFMTSQYGMLRNPSKQKQRHLKHRLILYLFFANIQFFSVFYSNICT